MAAKAGKDKSNSGSKTANVGRSLGKSVGKSASKRGDRKASGKAGKRAGKKAAGQKSSDKKKASAKKNAQRVMAAYKDARISDVSDKVFVASSPVHGKGLFATKRIKANTVLGRLHGMPTVDDGIYVLWITDDLGLELTNDFRFINHDKNPNAAYSDLDVMTLRDVEAGEELLHDYGW